MIELNAKAQSEALLAAIQMHSHCGTHTTGSESTSQHAVPQYAIEFRARTLVVLLILWFVCDWSSGR